jgi:hypothetical protein
MTEMTKQLNVHRIMNSDTNLVFILILINAPFSQTFFGLRTLLKTKIFYIFTYYYYFHPSTIIKCTLRT